MAKSAAPFLPIASPAPALPFKAAPTQSRPQLPPSLQQEPPYKAVPTAKSFEQPGQFTRDSSPDASPQNRSASHSNPTLLQSGQTLSGFNAVFSNLQDYPRCDDASMVGTTSISCTRIGACSSIPSAAVVSGLRGCGFGTFFSGALDSGVQSLVYLVQARRLEGSFDISYQQCQN